MDQKVPVRYGLRYWQIFVITDCSTPAKISYCLKVSISRVDRLNLCFNPDLLPSMEDYLFQRCQPQFFVGSLSKLFITKLPQVFIEVYWNQVRSLICEGKSSDMLKKNFNTKITYPKCEI